jgi:DMSO/TMAO reductase YedYZ molybdopterin-dependent catalytic subunit
VWGYQFTQGLHVATGIAAVPLLLAKLWTVYPRLFAWPPARDLGHALERLFLVPLVAGTVFELASGLLNIVQWYPWRFYFPRVHFAVAWVVVGSLLVHLAAKAPVIVTATGRRRVPEPADDDLARDRRVLLLGVGAAVGAVTLATVGQSVRPLRAVSVLAPRDPALGPQGLPVTRSAAAARIHSAARDPAWRLVVDGPRPILLSLDDLAGLPRHVVRLPIACVEGWNASAAWSGVRLRDVLDLAAVPRDVHVRVVSLEQRGLYSASPLGPSAARDPLTLLALGVNGSVLDLDHGYPLRLIAPDRPGVQQTKWLSRIEVASHA